MLLLELGGEKDAPPGSCQTFEDTDRSPYFWTGQSCSLSPNCFLFFRVRASVYCLIDGHYRAQCDKHTTFRPGFETKHAQQRPYAESVPDPDPEMVGGGGGGEGRSPKKTFFLPFGPPFGLKLRGGGGEAPRPLPWIATEGKEGLWCQCEDNRTGCLKLGFSKNFLIREHYELFKKRFRISLTVRHLLL